MSDDAVSDNTPISRGTTLEKGARVRVVRCSAHPMCEYTGKVGTVTRLPAIGWGGQHRCEVDLDGTLHLSIFEIDDLEEIL